MSKKTMFPFPLVKDWAKLNDMIIGETSATAEDAKNIQWDEGESEKSKVSHISLAANLKQTISR